MKSRLIASAIFVALLSTVFECESFAYANDSLVHYTNDIPSLSCVDWGNYVVSASGAALIRFEKVSHASKRLVLAAGVGSYSPTIRGLGVDRGGTLWILSPDRIPSSTADFVTVTSHPVYDRHGKHPYLKQIAMDSSGGIWVAGALYGSDVQASHFMNGVWHSFDTTDGLLPESLRLTMVDRHGTFWMEGIETSTGRTGKAVVTSITPSGLVTVWRLESGLPTGDLNAISLGQGDDIWVSSNDGVSQFHNGIWKFYHRDDFADAPHTYPTAIASDGMGNVWVGGYSELSRFDGAHWTSYPLDSIAPGSTLVLYMLSIPSGSFWIGTDYGMLRYSQGSYRFFSPSSPRPFPSAGVAGLARSNTDNPWISTDIGVCRFNGETWDVYSPPPTILAAPQADYSNLVQVSRTGDVWFSYYQGGIGRFDGKTWYHYEVADGLPTDSIFGFVNGGGPNELWILSSNSLVHWDGSQFKTYAMSDTAQHARRFQSIACDSQGTVWVGSYTQYILRKSSNFTFVAENPELWRFDGSTFIREPMPFADGLSTFQVKGLCVSPDNVLYLAGVQKLDSATQTYSGGLFKHHGSAWSAIDLTSQFGNKFDSSPFDLTADARGRVWIVADVNNFHGSYQDKVLSVYDGAKWNYVTEDNGMDTITFGHLHSFSDGSVWCGTNHGAYKFVDLKPSKHFDVTSGMLVDNIPEALPTAEGSWFSTAYGLTHYIRSTASGVASEAKAKTRGLSIWPNPYVTNHGERIHISSPASITSIALVDELGRSIFSQRLPVVAETYDFNPSSLPSGQYQVVVHDELGQLIEGSLKVIR